MITLLAYGLIRQLYANFYGTLGASPEEVGLDPSQVLTVSAIPFIAVAIVVAAVHYIARVIKHRFGRSRSAQALVAGTWALVVIGLAGVGLSLFASAGNATDKAFRGGRVTSVNIGPIQVLALRAEPAIVTWTGPVPSGGPPIVAGACYLYLGQANDQVVLFDPGPDTGSSQGQDVETIRVEARSVSVAVSRGAHLPIRPNRIAPPSCHNRQLVFS